MIGSLFRNKKSVARSQYTSEFGAVWDGNGVRFSLYAENPQAVELCLFDKTGSREITRTPLSRVEDGVWSVYVSGIGPGQRYGFRAHGDYAPQRGYFYNPEKLLIDPYAFALDRKLQWFEGCHPYDSSAGIEIPDKTDNAAAAPKSVVIDHAFDWGNDVAPRIALKDTVIYELHVKGYTQLHPAVPKRDRGTYRGLAAPAVLRYLRELGVTAVELLPCMASFTNKRLLDLGLSNYWGYDPVAWFAPDQRMARADAVLEFKQMVKVLHGAGIEVIMDVVFNHTGEEDAIGPMLSFRGIDNPLYYRLDPVTPQRYIDSSGCGNGVQAEHPYVSRMIIECLKYWVTQMHVDGFRFDLATCIAREQGSFNPQGRLMSAIMEDPVLSTTKLIAEPWDLGPGGYQLGSFPQGWCEWNDRYRDTVRAYWKGEEGRIGELASRISGSSDIFRSRLRARSLQASINYITAHDGFSLRDLVSYQHKHNEANGEQNRDGHDNNHSANYGVEGPGENPEIYALRLRQRKNLLTTLLLSAGTPMLLAGDEFGHTQAGNNNAYCQDNELSWLDWTRVGSADSLIGFVRNIIACRKSHPVFARENFFGGSLLPYYGYRDIEWFRPDGLPMSNVDWGMPFARCLIALMVDAGGEGRPGDSLLWILNAGDSAIQCNLPQPPEGGRWKRLFDTAVDSWNFILDESFYTLEARATAVFTEHRAETR